VPGMSTGQHGRAVPGAAKRVYHQRPRMLCQLFCKCLISHSIVSRNIGAMRRLQVATDDLCQPRMYAVLVADDRGRSGLQSVLCPQVAE